MSGNGGEAGFALPAGTVTLLLADLEGSVRLWEADREAMTFIVARLQTLVSDAIGEHGGVRPVEQGEGDSFVAAFSRASDAVTCALALQFATLKEAWPGDLTPRLRMGLNTGEVQLRDEGNYMGVAINRCARLRDTGHGGQVLLSRATHDLVADRLPAGVTLEPLGTCRLRDLARPEEVYQLRHPDLPAEFPPLRSLDALPNNLPIHLTSFIGREAEMAEIERLLADNRMVTLTGAGGSGKTRLALQVAANVLDQYRDGVWLADLAPVADPGLVAGAVASVLGVTETSWQPLVETIAARMSGKNILLVLDNCEHVVSVCAELATALVRACPSVVVLATSREPLGVEGEVAWRVPSLTMPGARESAAVESLTQFEAVRLFIDRALRSRPNFTITNDTAPAVAEICHRLDGIPLAIELAAARVRLLSPPQIAEGLGDRFRLLTGGARTAMPRQQTLEASVDWSYDLLSAEERRLLRRLSVFAGSFSLDAAEAVCSGEGIEQAQVLDLLSHLVDRSLVQVEDAQPVSRYRLLETIRQYGRRKLADAGEQEALRDRHLDYFVEWAGPPDVNYGPGLLVDAVGRQDLEIENIRGALDWAEAACKTDEAMRLGASLVWLWWLRRGVEGRRRLEAILAMPGGDPLLRASVKTAISQACWTVGDPFTGIAFAQEAHAAARDGGHQRLLARAMVLVGWHSFMSGRPGAGESLEQAIELLPEGDDYFPIAASGLGAATFLDGDWPTARRHLEEFVARARATREFWSHDLALMWLAIVAVYQGDFAEADRVLDETLDFWKQKRDDFNPTTGFAWSFHGLLRAWRGEPEAAIEALETAVLIGTESGAPWVDWISRWHQGHVEYGRGEYATAQAILEGALPLLRAFNERTVAPQCLALLVETLRVQGRIDEAKARAAELTVGAARGSVAGPIAAAGALARATLAIVDGDLETADELTHEALTVFARAGAKTLVVDALQLIAVAAAGQESYREAARLLGAAQGLRDAFGYRWRLAPDLQDGALSSAREGLGAEDWEAAWAEGGAMSLDEAVAYATRGRGERKRPSAGWASLTPTELDVVRLVAEGLTNPQIAARLFVARGTVKVHLSHVFGKLGVSTRSELAAMATQRGL